MQSAIGNEIGEWRIHTLLSSHRAHASKISANHRDINMPTI
jgi:hypothetical protein